MRALVQRVSEARVEVAQRPIGSIGPGLLVLFCAVEDDTMQEAERLATKIAKLRIFEDDAGKMNRAVADTAGAVLVVSQFTLAADTRKGNRPSFITAARPEIAVPLMQRFIGTLRDQGLPVETGEFGATMAVHLVNDGPVTIWLDTRD
ncbi:MAG: D-aminoacyl-tRNA deacylase [Proteobacteria bacterium]|nr:D-aminoacyl-tRNA deacylase [Pseudomonadota bacterium]MDA1311437.1 D-aminoacyl-tRNA deacylase [Pseudomonadota bacterium]